jgi:hypothetical protein
MTYPLARYRMANDIKVPEAKEVFSQPSTLRRGRLAASDWQSRTRYALRYLDDPIGLQISPLSQTAVVDQLAQAKYPNGIVAPGRALHDLLIECLQEIENALAGHSQVAKLKAFIALTRQGKGVTEASRAIGVSPEYASRSLKRILVELLTERLMLKTHSQSSGTSPSLRPPSKPGVTLLHLGAT